MTPATDAFDDASADELEPAGVVSKRVGTLVAGTYRITRHIGSGGSSHVFEAEHVRLGKIFALKLLRAELDDGRRAAQRFRREAKAIARLQSEHIVSVVDCGELDDRTPYLVMERLQGEDLRSLLKREGALSARRAVPIVVEACRGLSVVHTAGLIHRDLKPENLFIGRRATGQDWCKVLDFGVAKMDASLSTAEGAIVGTARYMAPEQLTNSAAVGPSTDVYALGAILYECLSGRPAHGGETIQEVMFSVMHSEPEPLSALCPNLPVSLVSIISRCLAKAQSERPSTAAQLEAELALVLESPHESGNEQTLAEDAAPQRLGVSKLKRQPFSSASVLLFAAFAALVGGAAARSWPADVPAPQPRATLQASSRLEALLPPPPAAPVATENKALDYIPTSSSPPPAAISAAATRRPVPRPVPSSPQPRTVSKPGVTVGSLDQSNPYGE